MASIPRPTPLIRNVIIVSVAVTISLGIMSGLHLSGAVQGHAKPYSATAAGVAEAVIGAVLVAAVVGMLRAPRQARTIGIAANAFGLASFAFGLSITARGGDIPDIAYHAAVLPIFAVTLTVLIRSGWTGRKPGSQSTLPPVPYPAGTGKAESLTSSVSSAGVSSSVMSTGGGSRVSSFEPIADATVAPAAEPIATPHATGSSG